MAQIWIGFDSISMLIQAVDLFSDIQQQQKNVVNKETSGERERKMHDGKMTS